MSFKKIKNFLLSTFRFNSQIVGSDQTVTDSIEDSIILIDDKIERLKASLEENIPSTRRKNIENNINLLISFRAELVQPQIQRNAGK